MKTVIIIFSIFSCHFLIGQSTSVTKKKILEAFRKEKKGFSQKKWETCNENDSFFKKDTIVFYERYDDTCKKRITWTFDDTKSLWQEQTEYAESWAASKVLNKEDHFNIKISVSKNETLLTVYNDTIQNIYLVHELIFDKENQRKRMTLIKKNNN